MLAVVLSLIAASLIGLVNGVITTVVGVSSFITTLGMFFFLNGLTLTLSDGRPVDTPGGERVHQHLRRRLLLGDPVGDRA